jgi:ABC-type transporter Mla subunit MlaD
VRVERSNFRAGIWTLAAIGAFCLALWGWLEWRASGRVPYEVWFSKEQGVYGLEPGAPLRVGGIRRGSITRIQPELRDGAVEGYVVHVEVDREVPITDRTSIRPESAGVSGESYLVAVNSGRRAPMTQSMTGQGVAGLLPPDSRIRAASSDGYLSWGGAASADLMRDLWEAWVPADGAGPGLWERLSESGTGMRTEGTKLSGEFSKLSADLDRDLPRWKEDFRAVREHADAAFGRIGTGKDAAPDTLVPQLRTIADDVREMPRIETERAERAGDAFDRAVASVKRLGARSAELRDMLDDADTAFGTTSADYALAVQDVDATVTEVLRAPWNVVTEPGDAQLAAMARQDLARLYAEAATDHQRAMKGIEDALRRDKALLEKDPALASLLRTRLEAANALFESRLADMESLLLGPAAGAAPAPAPGTP